MPPWLATYTETLATLMFEMKNEVMTWSISSAPARMQELAQRVSKLDVVVTSINVHVPAVEERVKRQRAAENTDQRRAQGERTGLLSQWRLSSLSVEGRVPLSLLRRMLDNGLLRPGHGSSRGVVMVGLARRACATARHAAVAAWFLYGRIRQRHVSVTLCHQ